MEMSIIANLYLPFFFNLPEGSKQVTASPTHLLRTLHKQVRLIFGLLT